MQKRLWYAREYSRERHEGLPHLCLCMHLRNGEEGPRKAEIRPRWMRAAESKSGRKGVGGFDIESQFTLGGR